MERLLPLELEPARERNGQPDCNFRSAHGCSPGCGYRLADEVRPEVVSILNLFGLVRNPGEPLIAVGVGRS